MSVDDTTREAAGRDASDFDAHEAIRIRGRSEPVAIHSLPISQEC
jgi:class 3 adenylate cyclase